MRKNSKKNFCLSFLDNSQTNFQILPTFSGRFVKIAFYLTSGSFCRKKWIFNKNNWNFSFSDIVRNNLGHAVTTTQLVNKKNPLHQKNILMKKISERKIIFVIFFGHWAEMLPSFAGPFPELFSKMPSMFPLDHFDGKKTFFLSNCFFFHHFPTLR